MSSNLPSVAAAPTARHRRVLLLILASALVLTWNTRDATAHSTSVGDEVTLALLPAAQGIPYTCEVDDEGQPHSCTPHEVGTVVSLRIVWALTGDTAGSDATIEYPSPAACGGNRGVYVGMESNGGSGSLSAVGYVTTADNQETQVFDISRSHEAEPSANRRVVCFP